MKVLLVSNEPGDILSTAARYFNEQLNVPAVVASIVQEPPSSIPVADAAIDLFLLRQTIAKVVDTHTVILAQDTLWADTASTDKSLGQIKGPTAISIAHNYFVMMQLLKLDIIQWDMIFFKPGGDKFLEDLCRSFHKVIILAEDETEATDEFVFEIASLLGLDDE